MSNLSVLSTEDAIVAALKALVYGDYEYAKGPKRYSTPFAGSFEEYFDYSFGDRDVYTDEGSRQMTIADLDHDSVWESFHSSGTEGTYNGFTAKVEKSHGGEGEGDQYWMVISITDGLTTRYFRKDGWYASYGNGGSLDGDSYEVKPQERTVVFYE